MQTFASMPTDAELASLLDPEGKSVGLRIDDSTDRLVIYPRGVPLKFVAVSIALPLIAIALLLISKWNTEAQKPLLMMLTIGCFIGPATLGMFAWMNWTICNRGPFLILDKKCRLLTLPRQNQCIPGNCIEQVIQISAWHVVRDGWTRAYEWLHEVAVVIRKEEQRFERYPVMTAELQRDAERWSRMLADFFGVERRVVKVDWRMRRRLKATGTAAQNC